jgi:uncharacterized protein YdeI (BOF family)
MPEKYNWLTQHIPFLALASANVPTNRPMTTRLLEQGFVGLFSAAVTLAAATIRHDEQLQSLRAELAQQRQDNKEVRMELRTAIEALQRDVYRFPRYAK